MDQNVLLLKQQDYSFITFTLHMSLFILFLKKKNTCFHFGRSNWKRAESDNKDNRRWRTGFYFRSPWASTTLLVRGTSVINVKICLRKWVSVIRTAQSLSLSLSFPPPTQPWNPAWNALHFKRKKSQFLIPFKKTECALSIKTWRAVTGPSLSARRTWFLFQLCHKSRWASFH